MWIKKVNLREKTYNDLDVRLLFDGSDTRISKTNSVITNEKYKHLRDKRKYENAVLGKREKKYIDG